MTTPSAVRAIEVCCDRHPTVALASFEEYCTFPMADGSPRTGWMAWRVTGAHAHYELIAHTPEHYDELVQQPPTMPAILRKMLITSDGSAPFERVVIRCPECGNNFPLNELLFGVHRARTFARLAELADALAAAPGVSCLPMGRVLAKLID